MEWSAVQVCEVPPLTKELNMFNTTVLDPADKGFTYQLPLEPIRVYVEQEFLCDVPEKTSYIDEYGKSKGSLGHANHPSFEATRVLLESKGYLYVERSWSNGDRVLKDFYFNNRLFQAGATFYCAPAMKVCHS